MGGRIRRTPSRELWGRWGAAVVEMADRLGWKRRSLWDWYEQFVGLVAYELRVPLEVAEDSAWRLLRASIDKNEVANERDGWVH